MTKSIKLNKKTIYFDDEKHRFWDEEGNNIPSVTSFTGIIDKSSALIGWAIKLTKQYLLSKIENGEQITIIDIEEATKEHRKAKEEAADIGTQIHEWIEKWIKGEKPEIPEDEKIGNVINAFLQFQKEYKVKWLETEKIVYSQKYNFAGILDAVGIINKKLVIFDFKSSNGIYSEYAFQTAGYQIAYEEMTGKRIDHRIIVRFGKDTGDFEWRKFDENEKDKKAFIACLTLKNRLKELE
jgi:CRISPR/Cas system-associated exonuclease Cas4 (RecB family)